MKYKCKAALINRKRNRDDRTEQEFLHITLYSKNNPTINGELPVVDLEFKNILKCHIYSLTTSFLTIGADLEINNLEEITIEIKNDMVLIEGKQSD